MKRPKVREFLNLRRPLGLPTWGIAALYLGLSALPLILASGAGIPPAGPGMEGSAAAGMVGMVLMVAQIGSSGRFPFLSSRVGIDVAMAFHKWAAPVALALLLAHPVLLADPFTISDPLHFLDRLGSLAFSPKLATGLIALVLFLVLTLMALLRGHLPAGYGLWRLSHVLLALAALLLALDHILAAGTYAAAAPLSLFWPLLTLGVVLIWLLRHLIVWLSSPWQVEEVRQIGDRLWLLKIKRSRGFSFLAGQFAWLRFGRSLSDHPFSIASTPHDGHLSFIIQEAGDFTSKIGRIAIGSPVTVDGPHGSFTLENLPDSDALLLIAGGVGVAPIFAILADVNVNGGVKSGQAAE